MLKIKERLYKCVLLIGMVPIIWVMLVMIAVMCLMLPFVALVMPEKINLNRKERNDD